MEQEGRMSDIIRSKEVKVRKKIRRWYENAA